MFKKKVQDTTVESSPLELPVKSPKKPFYKRTWFIVLVVLCSLSAIFGGSDSSDDETSSTGSTTSTTESATENSASTDTSSAAAPSYTIINDSSYVSDGQECIAYRVEIAVDSSEDEMRSAYAVLIDDDYYLHTVFFYELASDVDTVGSYTVGKLEELSEGASPEYTAPTISASNIAALRAAATAADVEEDTTTSSLTLGEANALSKAGSYLSLMAFSYNGLIKQLEYEGYTIEEATYAADNCGADWSEQALLKAESYLSLMAFSYSGLIEQLEYEEYTADEATYAADNCDADWNEQAALKAQSYLDIMAFSRDSLINQLEYEGFTASQCEYGVTAVGY